MKDQPGTAHTILAEMQAQTRAARDALDGLTRAADAHEANLQQGIEGPFDEVFNAPPASLTRTTFRSKIDADPELEAFIRARVMA